MPIWRAMRINFGQKHAAKQAKRCLLAPSGAARTTGMCILFTNHGNNIYIQKALTMACILCAPFGRGADVWWKCGDRRSSSTKDQPEVGTSITVSTGSPCPSHSMHTTANDDDVSGDSPLLIYMKMIRFKRLPNPPEPYWLGALFRSDFHFCGLDHTVVQRLTNTTNTFCFPACALVCTCACDVRSLSPAVRFLIKTHHPNILFAARIWSELRQEYHVAVMMFFDKHELPGCAWFFWHTLER